jgi:hypothetical protein
MSYRSYYTKGDWSAICDVCGRKFLASALRKRWDGLMVDHACWETRQPQDFVRGVVDTQVPPWTRPESQDTFITTGCNVINSSAVAGIGIAGCMIAGKPLPLWWTVVPPSTFNEP